MTTHEAVLGGARWRLTLHEDGRWAVARLMMNREWDERYAGGGSVAGVRESATLLRKAFVSSILPRDVAADLVLRLADIAERAQSNGVTQEGA